MQVENVRFRECDELLCGMRFPLNLKGLTTRAI